MNLSLPARLALRAAWMSMLLLAPLPAAAQERANGAPVRFRLEWGGGPAHVWNGLLELSAGRIVEATSLGTEAEVPGTVWIDDGAVWIQRRAARVYDGLDVELVAPPDATLSITLQSVDHRPVRVSTGVRVSDLFEQQKAVRIGDGGERLVLRRTPGDALSVSFSESHLVFEPGSEFRTDVTCNVWTDEPATHEGTLRWRLSPARSREVLRRGDRSVRFRTNSARPRTVPLVFPLPKDEGVYDLHLELRARGVHERSLVQLVVYSVTGDAPDGDGEVEETVVDEFRPARASPFRRIERRRFRSWSDLPWDLPGLNPSSTEDPDAEGDVQWNACQLRIRNPGRPHRLTLVLDSARPHAVGVSVLEPNAAGQLVPVGLDSGVRVDEEATDGAPVHEIVFWPREERPVLLLHDLGTGEPFDVARVRVVELSHLPPASAGGDVPSSGTRRRLVGPYLHKPLLPETFGGTEAFDEESRRSLDDWQTFYDATQRMADYLRHTGANAVLLGVLADGSTIYPSRLLEPTPRYDTGRHFSTGQDPVRKDVVELLLRVFARRDVGLVAELQFSAPLPVLERQLARRTSEVRGIELVGRDGRSWREARGSRRGLAPYYNPLDPRVQDAVVEVVEEFVQRYGEHDALAGVAVELSSYGYLQYPDLNWGYDEATVARFERETGIRVPIDGSDDATRARFDFLTTTARREWVAWRCRQLAKFHARLAKTVTAANPRLEFVLAGNRVLRGTNPRQSPYVALRAGRRLESLFLEKGLDFSRYEGLERTTVLRPVAHTAPLDGLERSLDDTINTSPNLDAAFRGSRQGGLFYHVPRETRIAEFDAVSPWQPALTWLPAHVAAAGPAARRHLAWALANYDGQMWFDGGWTTLLGQEDHLRRARRVVRQLPGVPFHRARTTSQPVTLRMAHVGQSTWLYAVNAFSDPVDVRIDLSCPPSTPYRELVGEETRLQPRRSGGSQLTLRLAAHDVVGFEFADPNVEVRNASVRLPDSALARLRRRIEAFDGGISELRKKRPVRVSQLSNPGFEMRHRNRNAVPGWKLPVENAAFWALDETNPRSGKTALVLTAGQNDVATVGSELQLDGNRTVVVTAWLRADQDRSRASLAVELELERGKRVQRVPVKVDRRWHKYSFRVDDVPADRVQSARLWFEVRGPARLWIDDVDVRLQPFARDDDRQLARVFSAVQLAWQNERYADCERLLDSYWVRLLEETNRAAESAATTEADDQGSKDSRRRWSLWPFSRRGSDD